MIVRPFTLKRALSTESRDIGQIFFQKNVQKLLKDITRFDEERIFANRTVSRLRSPKFMFMTDDQLDQAKKDAYEEAKARIQMPPVMSPDNSAPRILAKNEEVAGYTEYKIMFVDISQGYTNRNRIMSVREPDGILRYPTHDERSRLNHMFYTSEFGSVDEPKLFQSDNLKKLLGRKEYIYIIDRACCQYEPDDPRFTEVTSSVYSHIDEHGDYNILRSNRHFGPMSLFLAFNKRIDGLLADMLKHNYIEDAIKLIKLYYICHNVDYQDDDEPLNILNYYVENHSKESHKFVLFLQKLEAANEKSAQEPNNDEEK